MRQCSCVILIRASDRWFLSLYNADGTDKYVASLKYSNGMQSRIVHDEPNK